jgi:regulator of sigma E protease
MITGRKPGDKFIEYAQMAGMFLLLGVMVYALGLDILRLFK